jgi:hypothetical protein
VKILDRLFGCLMILGGIGHGVGSFGAYRNESMTLLWALSASFAGFLLAALNLLRGSRDGDLTLAWISLGGCLVWTGFVTWFGVLIGNFVDFRVLINLVITLALAAFSLRSVFQSSRYRLSA